MLVNAQEPEESRIAILEDDSLEELYIQPAASERYLGNIYKGRITNVQSSIQAAFVDIGLGKNAFLHVSDVKGKGDENYMPTDSAVAKRRKDNTPIQKLLRKGQDVLVQVTKDAIGSKGASVTTYVSLPGRYLVMMPGVVHHGVSRKITDEKERKRLRKILEELDLPEGCGFIIRTAGRGARKRDLQRDLRYLKKLWSACQERFSNTKAPCLAYQESDIVIRCMRDVLTADIEEIIIDSEEVARRTADFLSMVSPSHRKRVKRYRGAAPIFARYGIEDAIQKTFKNEVKLPCGGSIVLDQTEAMVAIDVNSGGFKKENDIEETALQVNLEAAREACRQLRLRDMGGLIVIDFIDMRSEKNRRKVEKAVTAELKNDRARSRTLRMSRFGLLQITRQRVRERTKAALFDKCPTCNGSGLVRGMASMLPHIMRQIRLAVSKKSAQEVDVELHPHVAQELSNTKRGELYQVEQENNVTIRITPNPEFGPGQSEVTYIRQSGKKSTL
jgi:ribonuclease E